LPGKHGPNRLANYLNVHYAWIQALLDEGFLVEDCSGFSVLPSGVLLSGTLVCLDGITLELEKEIAILKGSGMRATVQTRRFRYHAWIRGVHNILRYESAHEHRPHAHKHLYDTFGTGLEREVIALAEEDRIPTLGEVVRELQAWHEANAARIGELR
jgi:hypothetical protein